MGNELPRRAAEAVAMEGYRSGVLSLDEVAEMLFFPLTKPMGFSKSAIENLEEVEADSRALEELLTE